MAKVVDGNAIQLIYRGLAGSNYALERALNL
jgi:hypothetical protein